MKLIFWVAGGLAVSILLDRFLLYLENRGWIYYRRKKPSSSALSNACLEVQQLLEPSKKYVIRIQKEDRKEQQEAGMSGEEMEYSVNGHLDRAGETEEQTE
ncbi:MAG: hypothetical protein N3G18_01360, partial [Candidatus Saccharicenans sp.]|nr:hypothetical protein [Candidatus Saccharicenans sp.]